MSLHIVSDRLHQPLKRGFGFRAQFVAPSAPNFPGMVAYNDLMSRVLSSAYFYVYDGISTPCHTTGYIFQGYDTKTDHLISFVPYSKKYDWFSDYQVYGQNFFARLGMFFEAFGLRSKRLPSVSSEHTCRHISFVGELTTQQHDFVQVTRGFQPLAGGRTYNIRTFDSDVMGGSLVLSASPLIIRPVAWSLGPTKFWNVLDLLDILAEDGLSVIEQEGTSNYWNHHMLSKVHYDVSSSGLLVTYHMYSAGLTVGSIFEWDGAISVPFEDADCTITPVVGHTDYPTTVGQVTYSYWNGTYSLSGDPGLYPSSPLEYVYSSKSVNPVFKFYMSSCDDYDAVDRFRSVSLTADKLSAGYALRAFQQHCDAAFSDILPSNLFSSYEAFKQAEGYLGVNVLQNIAKLPSIASAIPNIREAVDILGRLVRRDLSLSTLKDIMSLASSTTLQYNFQWSPYKRLLDSYVPELIRTYRDLFSKDGITVGRGQYLADLGKEFGRDSVILTTRTKMVVDFTPLGVLSALLGVDALGILPKPSNIWDLIPFSFLANWFTGVGESMRRAEFGLIATTLAARYIHTYTLTSRMTDDELDSLSVSNSGRHEPYLKVYYRDISSYSPYPRDSRFGFGVPSGLPPMGSLGALLYQLVFS